MYLKHNEYIILEFVAEVFSISHYFEVNLFCIYLCDKSHRQSETFYRIWSEKLSAGPQVASSC